MSFRPFVLNKIFDPTAKEDTMSFATIVSSYIIVYFIVIFTELIITWQLKRFLLELAAVVLGVCLALLVTHASTGRVAFGDGISPLWAVAFMFIATMFGIMARYIFYLQPKQFSWFDCLKPLAITPIILLPLIGSVQDARNLNGMQSITFAFLAFQNGFFWQTVLEKARPTTRE